MDEQQPSLSQTLESALDKFNPPAPTPPAGPAESEGAPPSRPAEPTAEAAPAGETGQAPGRDEKGRFLSKAAPESPAATPAAAPVSAAPPKPALEPAVAAVPQSWPKDVAPLWEKMPDELKTYMHKREGELQAGFQQVAAKANIAEAVLAEFVPYADILQQEQATPVAAIRTLLQTAHALRTAGPEYKKAIIYSLAQQYGVDLTQQFNPQMAQVEAENARLMSERMYGTSAQTQQMARNVEQHFYAFAQDPANEFFAQVRPIMANLIGTGVANDLQTAYNMALGMHPEVRDTLVKREVDARAAETKRRTAASSMVTGAPGGRNAVPAASQAQDLRASIEAAFEGRE